MAVKKNYLKSSETRLFNIGAFACVVDQVVVG